MIISGSQARLHSAIGPTASVKKKSEKRDVTVKALRHLARAS
jgi:hypothetical protein